MTEEEISMVLNTYMYLDYKEAENGMTLNEILADLSGLPDCQKDGLHFGEYQVLCDAAQNPEIGNLIIDNQSHLMGYDSGTAACTFSDGKEMTYVVYRGTGDGEWLDNGLGMTEASTLQQERALNYFETVAGSGQISEEERFIVTGHSKGGNKAQYVTMVTEYGELVDACYNIDGQGFSEKAIAGFKESLGSVEYTKRTQKITGIYGENDYVNVLGISIVPEENVYYVRTPVAKTDFAGYHDIKYMFAQAKTDPVTGETLYIFKGSKNAYVKERGELGDYAATLSEWMMQMPEEKRDGCAAVIMQLLELKGTRKGGLNGEKVRLSDLEDFLKAGVPLIGGSLFATEAGNGLLAKVMNGKSFTDEMQGTMILQIHFGQFAQKEQDILLFTDSLAACIREAEGLEQDLGRYMPGSLILRSRLAREVKGLYQNVEALKKLAVKLEHIRTLYHTWDVETDEKRS